MKIYGFDFTSAPSRRKPITGVKCQLTATTLQLDRDIKFASFAEFEVFLKRRGPWVAGFDFPFGQPRRLIERLGWPKTWATCVHHIATMGQQAFEQTIAAYRQSQPVGHKHHKRASDDRAGAVSPMMLHGVPVGKMFFQGTPRLLRAGVSILPCHLTTDDRIALETYPALVARKWLGRRSYKSDTPHKQTAAREAARRELINGLCSEQLQHYYGLTLALDDKLADSLIQEPKGDSLDALLCAIQAAWAYTHRKEGYGIPANCDLLEGWIVDPETNS